MRAGVIGLGVGEAHVRAYQALTDVEVVSVCDIDPDRVGEIADRYRVSGRHTDYRKVTEDPDIDVVSICSYDDAHAEQAISSFRHGKHVMVEKPVALEREDAARVLEAQESSGRFISSNFVLRASPRFQEIRRRIRSGEFGEVFAIEGDYLHPILHKIVDGWRGRMDTYCVTYGGGIHLIDLMRWMLGDEVVEVAGLANKLLTAGSAYRYPDTYVNVLKFSRGALGKTMTTFGPARPKFHSLGVFGTEATFVNDVPSGRLYHGDDESRVEEISSAYPGAEKGALIGPFVDAVRRGVEPEIGAEDVFRVMDVCFATRDAVESGRTVDVSYLL